MAKNNNSKLNEKKVITLKIKKIKTLIAQQSKNEVEIQF
jgi:hypothetical protein